MEGEHGRNDGSLQAGGVVTGPSHTGPSYPPAKALLADVPVAVQGGHWTEQPVVVKCLHNRHAGRVARVIS